MRIFRVSAIYGELRSTGYPAYSNTRHEVSFTAALETGETAKEVLYRLEGYAKAEVKRLFGDPPAEVPSDLEKPYVNPNEKL